jgi:hypothetical protein
MSRSQYIDDCDDNWQLIRWRGMVASAIRGKRGQQFLKDLLAALDAMPVNAVLAYRPKNKAKNLRPKKRKRQKALSIPMDLL